MGEGFEALGAGCPNLTSLNMDDCIVLDAGLREVSTCAALRTLNLGLIKAPGGLGPLVKGCPSLTLLQFQASSALLICGLPYLSVHPTLEYVIIMYSGPVNDDLCKTFKACRVLGNLQLQGDCRTVTDYGLKSLVACPELDTLEIRAALPNVSEAALARAVPRFGHGRFRHSPPPEFSDSE